MTKALFCLAVAAVLAGLPEAAQAVSGKEAIRIMNKAGYSGIGGVTRSKGLFIAAADTSSGKRVRVSVDADTGAIVRVAPFPRGAGSVTPPVVRRRGYVAPRIQARAPTTQFPYYHAPGAPRAIGVRTYPWKADGSGPAAAWCRYRANAPGC